MTNKRIADSFQKISPNDAAKQRILRRLYAEWPEEGLTAPSTARRGATRWFLAPAAVFLAAAITAVCLRGYGAAFSAPGNSPSAESSSPLSAEKAEDFLILTAYAAANDGQVLTANYLAETVATKLEPDVEVPLPAYSLVTGSVPGLPFTFRVSEGSQALSVSVDNGSLLGWNPETGVVSDYGKTAVCESGDTLYWSPLSGSGTASEATVLIRAAKEGRTIAAQSLFIKQTKPGCYSAKAGRSNAG